MDDCGDCRLAFRGHHLKRQREGGALPVHRRVGDNGPHHPRAVQTRIRSFIVKAIVRASSSDGASISKRRAFSIGMGRDDEQVGGRGRLRDDRVRPRHPRSHRLNADMTKPRRKEVMKNPPGLSRLAGPDVRVGGIRFRSEEPRMRSGPSGPGGRVMDPAKGLGSLYQARRRMNRRVYLAPPSMRGLGSPPCQTPPDMPWPFCSEMPISSNWAGLYLSMNVMGTPMTPQ